VAAVQPVIALEVADDGLGRLASLEQRLVLVAQAPKASKIRLDRGERSAKARMTKAGQ